MRKEVDHILNKIRAAIENVDSSADVILYGSRARGDAEIIVLSGLLKPWKRPRFFYVEDMEIHWNLFVIRCLKFEFSAFRLMPLTLNLVPVL